MPDEQRLENEALQAKITELEQKLALIEASDRTQSQSIKLALKIQGVSIVALLIGFALGWGGFTGENRAAAERLALGIIPAAIAALAGAGYVEAKKES